MNFKDILKMTFNLVALYLVGGLLLAAVYAKTAPVIFRKNAQEKKEALQKMMPNADKNGIIKLGDWYPHDKDAEYFVAKKDGKVIGYIVQTYAKGYSSYINILFAVNDDFVVQRIDILHHAETPGLGDEIALPYFKKRFKGKDLKHLKVVKRKTDKYVQAITGATISSRAVTKDGIKKGLEFLIKALKKGEVEHGASAGRKG
ncbi:electron transport complex protein RnfG [bacterium BMS3Bbin06]|nr:electron transport complex protein RnfG [bacterium BMS3Abin08]GBE35519.1 electron transport complex protein RnfG [bacterium BMS3Bbin06]HDO35242.1 RnfABCDGE type electron transport complex subunit G [Nitrospirota bacterium]HDY72111.1 RnfABCDGE type electron transport complex subunit G [Nitrospirota bacterium]